MSRKRTVRHAVAVLGAAAVLVALAGGLAVRAERILPESRTERLAGAPIKAPVAPAAGRVPEPRPLALADVPTPRCWSCPGNHWERIDFELDLDHLAPLGDGPSNFAKWMAGFAQGPLHDGPGRSYPRVDVVVGGSKQSVIPFDDPLLAEVEPWLAQGTCRFYPDVWALDSMDTPIPNLLFAITLSRTYVARGRLSDDPQAAREDFRRAIRLGRLLYQEDATLIQHLVAIACIRMGTAALNEQARAEGDALLVAATATVLADHDAMRSRAAARVSTATRLWRALEPKVFGGFEVRATEEEVHAVVEMARKSPDRRFRFEAILSLRLLVHLDDGAYRSLAREALEEIAAGDDPLLSREARLALDSPYTPEQLEQFRKESSN